MPISAKPRSRAETNRSKSPAVPRSGSGLDEAQSDRKTSSRSRATAPSEFKSSMLNVRVTDRLKNDATRIFDEIGISLPEAVRVFLSRVVRQRGFPFALEVPNATTVAALKESRRAKPRKFATADEMFDALDTDGAR